MLEIVELKQEILNFLDKVTTTENLNIIDNYTTDQIYKTHDTSGKITFIKEKFNYNTTLQPNKSFIDIFIDQNLSYFNILKGFEDDDLKTQYENLLTVLITNLDPKTHKDFLKIYNTAKDKFEKLKKTTGGKSKSKKGGELKTISK